MIRTIDKVRLTVRRVTGAPACGVILAYHRVAPAGFDPHQLSVSAEHFAEHLQVIRQLARPVRLDGFSMESDRGQPCQVALTFDDGYADVLYSGKPLLERYGMPATVFAVGGAVGAAREFWWDELEALLLQPGTFVRPVQLDAAPGGAGCIDLSEGAQFTAEQSRRWSHWTMASAERDDPTPRHGAYRRLYRVLRGQSGERQREVLSSVRAAAILDAPVREARLPLGQEELVQLARDGSIEVGAHTETHALLSAQPSAEQRREIYGSRTRLTEIVGRPVTSFAFPYGSPAGYTAETLEHVRGAGYQRACAVAHVPVSTDCSPFELPRVTVPDCDGDAFARALTWLMKI
jgi:peptidoglycan/xylan/chitin deacetylase (PgdA/CDA1 family)